MIKKHLGIFVQVPLDASDAKVADSQRRVDISANKVEKFYRSHSSAVGLWDVKVRGFVMRGEDNVHPPNYGRSDIRIRRAEGLDGFDPNYEMVIGGASGSYCGQAPIGGFRSVIFPGVSCSWKSIVHEWGHNLGLHHASTLRNGDITEYGDSNNSIMGSGTAVHGLTSPHLVLLGFEHEREIKRITETTQVLICPTEMMKHGMHPDEWQNVIIEDGGKEFFLSLRKTKGVVYPAAGRSPEKLYIHELTNDAHSVFHSGTLSPGSGRTISNNLRIQYEEYANETARVSIFLEDNVVENVSMPVGFPEPMGVSVEPKHSGTWGDKDFSGQGLDIHITDTQVLLFWYTYNVHETSRRFYWAMCDRADAMKEFKVYSSKGTWEDPAAHTLIEAGTGQLYFFDDTNGVFNYNTEEHGRNSFEVTISVKPQDNELSGSFYQPSRSGEGFTQQFYSVNDETMVVMFWYSYGRDNTSYAYKGNGTQRWYLCDGMLQDDGTYDLTVYEILDGEWMDIRDYTPAPVVGSAKLSITDTDNLVFDFDINADLVNGKGMYNLKRVF
jgi:hypothetical protein